MKNNEVTIEQLRKAKQLVEVREVGEDRLVLCGPEEFRFTETLVYLSRSPNECLHVVGDRSVRKLLRIAEEQLLVEIESPDNRTLQVRFLNGAPTQATRRAVADYVWEWFDLETDLRPFYHLAEQDPVLQHLVEQYRGFRIVRIPDLFEALCWAIMGQQINLTFAYTLKRRFVESFGEHLLWEGQEYWLFPRPEAVAKLSVDDLRGLQLTEKKAEYLLEVAKQVSAQHLTKQALRALSLGAAEKAMVKVRGIGPWTANYVLMRCIGAPSAFPIADVGLHNAIKVQLNMDRKPTLEEIGELAIPWQGWEAYATFYLWRSLYEKIA